MGPLEQLIRAQLCSLPCWIVTSQDWRTAEATRDDGREPREYLVAFFGGRGSLDQSAQRMGCVWQESTQRLLVQINLYVRHKSRRGGGQWEEPCCWKR